MTKNHKPHATPDLAAVPAAQSAAIDVLGNDVDKDGDVLSLDGILKAPRHGIAEIIDGSVLYTPDADWHGKDKLTYLIDDGHGGTAHGHATVVTGLDVTGTAASEHWKGTAAPDVFNERFEYSVFPPQADLRDLGHDTIRHFGRGDVLDFRLHLDDGAQVNDLGSLDLLYDLDANRDGVLSAADGDGVKVHGHSITLDLSHAMPGNMDDPTIYHFTGQVTVKGKTELTAADLLHTTAPGASSTALDHVVHTAKDLPVG
jgi:hypothetical protein